MALAVLAIAAIIAALDPPPVRETRLRGFDMAQRLWPQPHDDILIETVAIDDESLRRLGQWPWPRTLVADLVKRIAAGKPRVLGIDILFAEPDRLSPPLLAKTVRDLPGPVAEALAGMPSSEKQLAGAIAAVPTVLGLSPSGEPSDSPAAPHRGAAIRLPDGDVRPFLTRYPSMVRSLPEIRAAARAEATATDEPDEDGVVRAVPLLSAAAGQLVAGFAVEVVRVAPKSRLSKLPPALGGIARVASARFPCRPTRMAATYCVSPRARRYISAAPSARSGIRSEPASKTASCCSGSPASAFSTRSRPRSADAGGGDPGPADRSRCCAVRCCASRSACVGRARSRAGGRPGGDRPRPLDNPRACRGIGVRHRRDPARRRIRAVRLCRVADRRHLPGRRRAGDVRRDARRQLARRRKWRDDAWPPNSMPSARPRRGSKASSPPPAPFR